VFWRVHVHEGWLAALNGSLGAWHQLGEAGVRAHLHNKNKKQSQQIDGA
jgi:hypothetical protein